MKIILSPSKLQKSEWIRGLEKKKIMQDTKTVYLKGLLSELSYDETGKVFKLQGKLQDETYARTRFDESEYGHAIATYKGVVFKEINYRSFDAIQMEYLLNHLVILSALYGVLEPDAIIAPYRLDMITKLGKLNLYEYWKEDIESYFEKEDMIINLASVEFSKILKKYRHRMINIHFNEEQSDGSLKVITVRAKQARGLMTDYLVSNCISDIDGIKGFTGANYHYDDELSNKNNLYFIKSYE
jgi:cytoplasmic iron level regulating protein YaaA (DUF328/UPF0246 family)